MKRLKSIISIVLILIMTTIQLNTPLYAVADFDIEGDKLVKYIGDEGTIQVPSGVKTIGTGAFTGVSYATIFLSGTVTTIEEGAFDGLEYVYLIMPSNVTDIHRYAVVDSIGLTIGCETGSEAFDYARLHALPYNFTDDGDIVYDQVGEFVVKDDIVEDYLGTSAQIRFPEGFIKVSDAFSKIVKSSGFTSIYVPGSYETFNLRAVENLAETIVIEEGVKHLTYEFYYDRDSDKYMTDTIGTIEVPKSVESMEYYYMVTKCHEGSFAHNFCIENAIPYVLYGKSETQIAKNDNLWVDGDRVLGVNQEVENLIIPEGITSIGASAFKDLKQLKTVQFPSTLSLIEASAFENCDQLVSVDIPDTVIKIGTRAFYDCDSLTDVKLPKLLGILGVRSFAECDALRDITIDPSNKQFDTENGIIYADGKTAIYQVSKGSGDGLSIDNLTGLNSIEAYAFEGCKINNVDEFDVAIEFVHKKAYANTEIASIFCIENSDLYRLAIREGIFYTLSDEPMIEPTEKAQAITTEVSIYDTANLNGVMVGSLINNDIVDILEIAYDDNNELWYLVRANNKEGYVPVWFLQDGYREPNTSEEDSWEVEEVELPDPATLELSEFTTERDVYIKYNENKSNVSVYGLYEGTEMRTLGAGLFKNFTEMDSVSVEKGILMIENEVFMGMTNLSQVFLPETLSDFGIDVFDGCTSLTRVEIPVDVIKISSGLFRNATNLRAVTFLGEIETIGSEAFMNCENLGEIYLPRSVVNISEDTFVGASNVVIKTHPFSESHKFAKDNEIAYSFKLGVMEIAIMVVVGLILLGGVFLVVRAIIKNNKNKTPKEKKKKDKKPKVKKDKKGKDKKSKEDKVAKTEAKQPEKSAIVEKVLTVDKKAVIASVGKKAVEAENFTSFVHEITNDELLLYAGTIYRTLQKHQANAELSLDQDQGADFTAAMLLFSYANKKKDKTLFSNMSKGVQMMFTAPEQYDEYVEKTLTEETTVSYGLYKEISEYLKTDKGTIISQLSFVNA